MLDCHAPEPADSAGQPWRGRSFPHQPSPFQADDGSAPQPFVAARRALHEGGAKSARGTALRDVVDAVRSTRLLVPLIAEAGEIGMTDEGKIVDKTQELSVVQVAGPDGAPITPMFTDVAAMQAWNAHARPVPIEAQRAAAAALGDSGRIVVDPGWWSEIVLTRDVLMAIVTGERWAPAWQDPLVLDRVARPVLAIDGVDAVVIEPHDPLSTLRSTHLVLRVVPGAPAPALDAALMALADDDVLRERVHSLGVMQSRAQGSAPPGSTVLRQDASAAAGH